MNKEILFQCKECNKRTIYNHPVLWKGAFERNYPDQEMTEQMTDEVVFDNGRKKIKTYPLGFYTCLDCQKVLQSK